MYYRKQAKTMLLLEKSNGRTFYLLYILQKSGKILISLLVHLIHPTFLTGYYITHSKQTNTLTNTAETKLTLCLTVTSAIRLKTYYISSSNVTE